MNQQAVLADHYSAVRDGVTCLSQVKMRKPKTALALGVSPVQIFRSSESFVPLMFETNIRPPTCAFIPTKCIP
jgi:hypothetical protein